MLLLKPFLSSLHESFFSPKKKWSHPANSSLRSNHLTCSTCLTRKSEYIWESVNTHVAGRWWDYFPGKNTRVGCRFLLQGIFPTQKLNQIFCIAGRFFTDCAAGETLDYTLEVINRFKGLDLIEYLKNYGRRFVTLYRRQGSRPSSRRNAKRQNGFLRRPYK